jgi:hypothetical protein
MAICAHCKIQETQLYENGVPVCIACAQGPSIKRKSCASEIRATLLQDLLQATAACHQANREFEETASFPNPPPRSPTALQERLGEFVRGAQPTE